MAEKEKRPVNYSKVADIQLIGTTAAECKSTTASLEEIEQYLSEKYADKLLPITQKLPKPKLYMQKYIDLRKSGKSRYEIALMYMLPQEFIEDKCRQWGLPISEAQEKKLHGWKRDTKKKASNGD